MTILQQSNDNFLCIASVCVCLLHHGETGGRHMMSTHMHKHKQLDRFDKEMNREQKNGRQ